MIDIIKTYFDRKLAALDAAKDEAIIAVKVTDPNYAVIRNLKKTDAKCENLINLGEFKFSDSIKEQINEIRKAYNADVKALTELCEEADAVADMYGFTFDHNDANYSEIYKDVMKELKAFGILTKEGLINA